MASFPSVTATPRHDGSVVASDSRLLLSQRPDLHATASTYSTTSVNTQHLPGWYPQTPGGASLYNDVSGNITPTKQSVNGTLSHEGLLAEAGRRLDQSYPDGSPKILSGTLRGVSPAGGDHARDQEFDEGLGTGLANPSATKPYSLTITNDHGASRDYPYEQTTPTRQTARQGTEKSPDTPTKASTTAGVAGSTFAENLAHLKSRGDQEVFQGGEPVTSPSLNVGIAGLVAGYDVEEQKSDGPLDAARYHGPDEQNVRSAASAAAQQVQALVEDPARVGAPFAIDPNHRQATDVHGPRPATTSPVHRPSKVTGDSAISPKLDTCSSPHEAAVSTSAHAANGHDPLEQAGYAYVSTNPAEGRQVKDNEAGVPSLASAGDSARSSSKTATRPPSTLRTKLGTRRWSSFLGKKEPQDADNTVATATKPRSASVSSQRSTARNLGGSRHKEPEHKSSRRYATEDTVVGSDDVNPFHHGQEASDNTLTDQTLAKSIKKRTSRLRLLSGKASRDPLSKIDATPNGHEIRTASQDDGDANEEDLDNSKSNHKLHRKSGQRRGIWAKILRK